MPIVLKSGSLNLLEPSGPVQACNGIVLPLLQHCGPGSVVGIATGYKLDGPGIESRRGKIFCTCSDRPWGPPSLLYNGYRVFPGGKERLGRDTDPSPPSNAVGHERVELYLYSPYGPYGLYRAYSACTRVTFTFTTAVIYFSKCFSYQNSSLVLNYEFSPRNISDAGVTADTGHERYSE